MYDKLARPAARNSGILRAMRDAAPQSSRPSERMTAWQRWEMASLNQPALHAQETPAPVIEAGLALEPLAPALLIDEAELARVRQQARQAGEAEGHRAGYEKGQAEGQAAGLLQAQEQAQRLKAVAQALPDALRDAQSEVAADLLQLALAIAHQVVHQTLAVDPEQLLPVVRSLLHAEPALGGPARLHLHPQDAALVRDHLADDLHAAGWRIHPDDAISRGGCRVHSGSGELDATLETRLQRVAAAMKLGAPDIPASPS